MDNRYIDGIDTRLFPKEVIKPTSISVVTPVMHNDGDKTLELLIRQCQQRGNRLEVMNGKIYEVSRKLIGEIK